MRGHFSKVEPITSRFPTLAVSQLYCLARSSAPRTQLYVCVNLRPMTDRLVHLASDLPPLPEDLLLARDRGEVLFVAGAGISRPLPAELPDFKGLVLDAYHALDQVVGDRLKRLSTDKAGNWEKYSDGLRPQQIAELKRFVDGEYDVVLGMLERRLELEPNHSSIMRRTIIELIGRAKKPTALHTALIRLSARFGTPLIVTTNFDRLFELAAKQNGYKVLSHSLGAMPQPSRRADFSGILHIHGALGTKREPASNLVLTDQDFGDAYLRRRFASDFIYDAARIFRIVLVGYSASDAPMRYLLNAIAGDELRFPDLKPRYAFVPADSTDTRTRADWRSRGIIPIVYSDADGHRALRETLDIWSRSVPEPDNEKWWQRRVSKIVKTARSQSSEADRSLFDYLFRRAAGAERFEFLRFVTGKGASLDWLDSINDLLRQEGEHGV
jgi:hypothetical protein